MEKVIYFSRRILTILASTCITVGTLLLMLHGDWWAIGYGLGGIAAPFILQYLFMPAGLLRSPALYFMDKRRPFLAGLSLLAGGLYESFIISLWFSGVLFLFMQYSTSTDFLIYISFAYAISLAPWLFISERLRWHETAGDAQRLFIASVHVAYLIIAGMICLNRFSPLQLMEIFTAITCAVSLIGSISAWNDVRKTLVHK